MNYSTATATIVALAGTAAYGAMRARRERRRGDAAVSQLASLREGEASQREIDEQYRAGMQGLHAKLESRVKARTAELETANRELEAFSYSVSHDLRAPLRTISGFCRILETEHAHELSADARRYLALIQGGAAQMAQLIDDLLAFSRLGRQTLRRARTDPNDVLRGAIATLEADLHGREIDWRIAALPPVETDATLLSQVFTNLLSNAIKFTRGRTPAVIEVSCERDPAGAAVFKVRDNGVGFDMTYAHKLFGVFQRLHRAEEYEGTGVGLAIVHRAVNRQGGRVWAESEPGRGASFYFTAGPALEAQ